MIRRIGSYLERDIGIIFEKVGCSIEHNSREFGFETDVIARLKDFTIIIETKQYDKSYINVKSILHEWASKGRTAKADKTLVVIAGQEINEDCFNLAKELGIYIWDENTINKLKKIESKNTLYGEIAKILEFKDLLEHFELIEKSDTSPSDKEDLKGKIIDLLANNGVKGRNNIRKKFQNIIKDKEREYSNEQAKIMGGTIQILEDKIKEHELARKLSEKNLFKKKIAIFSIYLLIGIILFACVIYLIMNYNQHKIILLRIFILIFWLACISLLCFVIVIKRNHDIRLGRIQRRGKAIDKKKIKNIRIRLGFLIIGIFIFGMIMFTLSFYHDKIIKTGEEKEDIADVCSHFKNQEAITVLKSFTFSDSKSILKWANEQDSETLEFIKQFENSGFVKPGKELNSRYPIEISLVISKPLEMNRTGKGWVICDIDGVLYNNIKWN